MPDRPPAMETDLSGVDVNTTDDLYMERNALNTQERGSPPGRLIIFCDRGLSSKQLTLTTTSENSSEIKKTYRSIKSEQHQHHNSEKSIDGGRGTTADWCE